MVNKYTESAKKSGMTQKVNRLHKMCLVPFFKDLLSYEGRLRKYVTDKDKVFWEKFLSCCFPGLRFETQITSMSLPIYIGSSNDAPNAQTILAHSKTYSTDNRDYLIYGRGDRTPGKYFWIALPSGYALERVDNLEFTGDYMSASIFRKENVTINHGNYILYYVKAAVPLQTSYKVILK